MVGPRADADVKNGGLFSKKDGRFSRKKKIRADPRFPFFGALKSGRLRISGSAEIFFAFEIS